MLLFHVLINFGLQFFGIYPFVPLDFQYSEKPLHEAVAKLIQGGRAPIYLVSFTQRGCAEEAQNFLSIDLCSKDEKRVIADLLIGFKFSLTRLE